MTGLAQPAPLFKFSYESGRHNWWSYVYEVRCELPVRPQVEEVDWYGFVTEEELAERLDRWEWVPDGRAAFERLRNFRGSRL